MLELNYNKKEWTLLKRNKGIPQNGFLTFAGPTKIQSFLPPEGLSCSRQFHARTKWACRLTRDHCRQIACLCRTSPTPSEGRYRSLSCSSGGSSLFFRQWSRSFRQTSSGSVQFPYVRIGPRPWDMRYPLLQNKVESTGLPFFGVFRPCARRFPWRSASRHHQHRSPQTTTQVTKFQTRIRWQGLNLNFDILLNWSSPEGTERHPPRRSAGALEGVEGPMPPSSMSDFLDILCTRPASIE